MAMEQELEDIVMMHAENMCYIAQALQTTPDLFTDQLCQPIIEKAEEVVEEISEDFPEKKAAKTQAKSQLIDELETAFACLRQVFSSNLFAIPEYVTLPEDAEKDSKMTKEMMTAHGESEKDITDKILQAKQRSAQLRQRIDELVELNKTLDDTIRDYREVV